MSETAPQDSRTWTDWQVGYLLRNAGRIPADTLCEKLERDPAEVERVTARLRTLGYPVSLTLAVCPSCGNMAPLSYSLGICEPCHQRRLYARVQGSAARAFRSLTMADRATYEETEAETSTRKYDPMPSAEMVSSDADAVERMRAEDKYLTDMAEWQAKRLHRQVKAAQKRKERMLHKIQAYPLQMA